LRKQECALFEEFYTYLKEPPVLPMLAQLSWRSEPWAWRKQQVMFVPRIGKHCARLQHLRNTPYIEVCGIKHEGYVWAKTNNNPALLQRPNHGQGHLPQPIGV
jgi:hypothetical protein